MAQPTKAALRRLDTLVAAYESAMPLVRQFQDQLLGALSGSTALTPYVHSFKARLKDPDHLRDKLLRQMAICRQVGRPFDITIANLLVRINDLAGIRILHLYTRQILDIDRQLREILDEQRYALLEKPFARTWDDESRAFFASCGIDTQDSPSLYTSVHYVVSSASKTTITCEVQVRTLMEEVWGEVDHQINYPHPAESLACREQIKVLARVTSSATRLVDSIFLTHQEHDSHTNEGASAPTRRGRRTSVTRRPKRR
jgi:ppGpp synthetase/RelA/SpoT-type nucleotidyltranferase